MKDKIITPEQAAEMIKDGSSVMVGGFMANGTAELVMDALVARGAKDLTCYCNDGGFGPQFDENGNETVPLFYEVRQRCEVCKWGAETEQLLLTAVCG